MKIGVMSYGSPDYLIDIVMDGLVRLLGRSQVALDYTQKARWGGQYAILMEGVEEANQFDIHDAEALVTSTRSLPAMKEWKRRTRNTRIALLDGEDGGTLTGDPSDAKVYFKREHFLGQAYADNVKPLPFGAIPEPTPESVEIQSPVFFGAHETHAIRRDIGQILTLLGYPPMTERLPKGEYNKKLMSSLLGVSVRGGGWDTYRYWETPYFGCALLSQRLPISIPDNFKEEEEAFFFDGPQDFGAKLLRLLEDPPRIAQVASAGRRACLDRHLSIHRAKRVLQELT